MLAGKLSTAASASPLSRRKLTHNRALVTTHAKPLDPKVAVKASSIGRRSILAGLTGTVSYVLESLSSNARADTEASSALPSIPLISSTTPTPNPDPTAAAPTVPAENIPQLLTTAEPSGGSAPAAAGTLTPQAPDSTSPSTAATSASPSVPSAATQQQQAPSDVPSGSGSKDSGGSKAITLSDEAAQKMLQEEDGKRKQRKRKNGRIRELEEVRAELAEKELILLTKEQELLDRDQTLVVLKEELELERKLRALLTKEKEKAEEEAALAMGLCTGGAMLP